jgi:hypothetical protein
MRNISEWLASNGITGREFIEADRRWRREAGSSWYRAPVPWDPDLGLEFTSDEHPGHLLVTGGRVGDSAVFDRAGERVGEVFDVSIHKTSGKVSHVLLGVGGFLGIGRRFHLLPWTLFTYAPDRRGYRLPLSRAEIARTPGVARRDLEWCGGGHSSPFEQAMVNSYLDLPFA